MKKLLISSAIINEIADFATQAFHKQRDLSRFTQREMQIHLILQGLESTLNKRKLEIPFEMTILKQEDSLPIDESGLDDMWSEKEPTKPVT